MKILAVDGNRHFLDDLNTRLLLSDDDGLELVSTLNNAAQLHTAIEKFHPDVVTVCANALNDIADWDIVGTNIIAYYRDPQDAHLIEEKGLPSFGVVKNTTHLLNLLNGPLPKKGVQRPVQPAQAKRPEARTTSARPAQEKPAAQRPQQSAPPAGAADDYAEFMAFMEWKKQQGAGGSAGQNRPAPKARTDEPGDELMDDLLEEMEWGNEPSPPARRERPAQTQRQQPREKDAFAYADDPQDRSPGQLRERARERTQNQYAGRARENYERDLEEAKPKTKVVTVYAAKGGVGKTTIATEVATYLALTAHGRGRYQVCIVDYNVDFGDVRSTLDFPSDTVGMYEWAMEIKDRIRNGEDPDSITYSRREMKQYLQKIDATGLYGLCAPVSHMESMCFDREELDIILRNIVQNGGFDFVICDTGNNTRDSSVFALMSADCILLVATQDVTTATCNSAAIEALEEFDIDISKIKLVLNNCMATKSTGISVQEVMDAFPYECIAQIRHDVDIIKANNLSVPIVFQANHPVTKEFQKIILFLTQGNGSMVTPKKRGLFGLKFRK